jgi:hypothetical protein
MSFMTAGRARQIEEFARNVDDVVYHDNDVCILHPLSSRGTLVFHASPTEAICGGLLSGAELARRGASSGRATRHEVIFFRAPWFGDMALPFGSHPPWKNLASPGTTTPKTYAVIRVDPERTNVFYSEYRATNELDKYWTTKHPMTVYLTDVVGSGKSLNGVPVNRNSEVIVKLPTIPREWMVLCQKQAVAQSMQAYMEDWRTI